MAQLYRGKCTFLFIKVSRRHTVLYELISVYRGFVFSEQDMNNTLSYVNQEPNFLNQPRDHIPYSVHPGRHFSMGFLATIIYGNNKHLLSSSHTEDISSMRSPSGGERQNQWPSRRGVMRQLVNIMYNK